jgi:hypothetical protein
MRKLLLVSLFVLAWLSPSWAQQQPMRVTAGGITGNPTSVLTRPANTTAYTANQLIASSVTAGSVVVPSFNVSGCQLSACAQSSLLRRIKLLTNATTGMGSATFTIEFWSAAPTFTNGDGGAYAVATGAAKWLGSMTITTFTQVGDGAYGIGTPPVGSEISMNLGPGNSQVFWTLDATVGFTPISGQTFTLVAEELQDD